MKTRVDPYTLHWDTEKDQSEFIYEDPSKLNKNSNKVVSLYQFQLMAYRSLHIKI